jgi:hypothetical protein
MFLITSLILRVYCSFQSVRCRKEGPVHAPASADALSTSAPLDSRPHSMLPNPKRVPLTTHHFTAAHAGGYQERGSGDWGSHDHGSGSG